MSMELSIGKQWATAINRDLSNVVKAANFLEPGSMYSNGHLTEAGDSVYSGIIKVLKLDKNATFNEVRDTANVALDFLRVKCKYKNLDAQKEFITEIINKSPQEIKDFLARVFDSKVWNNFLGLLRK